MLVDAPLSGPDGTPEQRGLTIFASGPERAQARIASVFDALGPRTIWMGPVGLGSRMKVVNNTLLAFIAEAIALAHNIELAAEAVMDAGAAGPPTSPAANAAIRRTARGENAPARSLALALQDVGLALDAAGHDRSPVLAQLAGSWSPS
jgi:3-hydroxyisobutyrate dehydrogenase